MNRPHLLARPRLWAPALAGAIVTALALLPLGSMTSAQEAADADPRVIDPEDPCSTPAPPAQFSDRNDIAEVHRASVDCALARGITQGTGDGRYAPRMAVRRDQMASFVVRTLQAAGGIDIPAPSDQGFTDVAGNTHEDAINQLAALGITQGRTPTRYAPAEPVRRDQMASFLLRAANLAFGTTFEAVGGPHFADVSPTNVHRGTIDAAFEIFGLTVGQTANAFAPGRSVRRDQMATFLIRLLDVTELTDGETAATSLLPGLPEQVDDLIDGATDAVGQVEPLRGVTDAIRETELLDGVTDVLRDDNAPAGGSTALSDEAPADTGASDPPAASDERSGVGGLIDRIVP
ncbi:MAG TPA: S-layer homology domain-containing protein [Egibacteraceae bacterium]|nr:S-layer homology domain-containing protein [Egibacteraceae bacterium]